jgi:hypothetical protein
MECGKNKNKNIKMRPYTKVNKAGNDEDLRRNWRGNKKCHRKKVDRPFKKKMRKSMNKIFYGDNR